MTIITCFYYWTVLLLLPIRFLKRQRDKNWWLPPPHDFFDIGFILCNFHNLWQKGWVVPQISGSFRKIIVTFLLCCQSFSRFYKIRFYLCTHLTFNIAVRGTVIRSLFNLLRIFKDGFYRSKTDLALGHTAQLLTLVSDTGWRQFLKSRQTTTWSQTSYRKGISDLLKHEKCSPIGIKMEFQHPVTTIFLH